jgi:ribonuclease J
MRVCIHRGAHAVGGSVVELEVDGRRLVLDVGLPLNLAKVPMRDLLPDVPGLWGPGDSSLEAVLVTHGHPDHVGLADLVEPGVPTYAGAATRRISEVAAFFVPRTRALATAGDLEDGVTIKLGPFQVTPVLVDHSAFDAYALVVEAGGRRLVYSGDIRRHGRKPRSLDRLARRGRDADVLLLEGTRIGRADGQPRSETDVEDTVADICRASRGWVLAAASAQNVDRLVSLFKAARRSGRELVLDLYAAHVLEATGRATIPQASWDGVRVYLPKSQKRRVLEAQAFTLTDRVKSARIYPDEIRERSGELLFLFRESMSKEFDAMDVPANSALVWSMWTGYLDSESGRRLSAFCEHHKIEFSVAHASGHANTPDLKRLVDATKPGRVVPIHTQNAHDYPRLFQQAEIRRDGEWFEL